MSKSSRRVKAARNQVVGAAEDKVHSAADRVGPLVHTAADRVGPLAQSAADRVGPLAEAAADRLGAVADKVSPLAHSAADKLGPLAHSAADHVAPLTHSAADRVSPFAHSAADRIAPLASQAVDRVGPYAQQAADRVTPYAQQAAEYAHHAADLVSPYAQQAADRLAPLASSARKLGAQAAHDAVERFGPALEDARDKVTDDLLPKLGEALSAAAASTGVAEVVALPEPKKKGRWLKRVAVVAAVAAVIALVARKFLGSKDADWQAARPSTPYTPSKATVAPETTPVTAPVDVPETTPEATAEDDPQMGLSAHEANLEANGETVPDAPAEGPDVADTAPVEDLVADTSLADERPADEPVGDEPTGLEQPDIAPAESEPSGSEPETFEPETFEPGEVDTVEYDTAEVDTAEVDSAGYGTAEFEPAGAEPAGDLTFEEPAVDSGPPPETPTAEIPEDAIRSADLPAPSGEPVEVDAPVEPEFAGGDPGEESDSEETVAGTERPKWEGEGVYVGSEPPEGYVIKGNERSKKYHLPESGGYSRTIAEVWFNSEEAAQTAGFIRAQR